MTSVVVAHRDPALSARVVQLMPLRYADGPDRALDRPAHVRAASGIDWAGDRLAIVQDDANFIALVDPQTLRVDAVTLPAGDEGQRQFDKRRGNKRWKLDLESCLCLPYPDGYVFVGFGSGSGEYRVREQIVVADLRSDAPPATSIFPAYDFYAQLRATPAFAGSELNIEGALLVDASTLRLFQRGNGMPVGSLAPVNATGDVDWHDLLNYLREPEDAPPPALRNIIQYDLGQLGGCPLTFTGSALGPGGMLYIASAEDSPNTVDDGPVAGSVLGLLEAAGQARWAPITEDGGALFLAKVEGAVGLPDDPTRLWITVDADDCDQPSLLGLVELNGPWWR